MLELLCIDYDNRLKAYFVTAGCDYVWHLNAVEVPINNLGSYI